MSLPRPLHLAWLLTTLLCAGVAFGQRFPTQVYTEADGMPSSSVLGMAQLDDGRLVVSTSAGIAFFDGFQWERQVIAGESHLRQYMIAKAPGANALYAIGMNAPHSTFRHQAGRWTRVPGEQPGGGTLLFAAARAIEGGQELVVRDSQRSTWRFDGEAWSELGDLEGTHDLLGLIACEEGFYFATPGGLSVYAEGELRALELDLPGQLVAVTRDPVSDDLILVGASFVARLAHPGAALVLERTDVQIERTEHALPWPATMTPRGDVLVAADAAVLCLPHERGPMVLDATSGLIDPRARALFVDREGLVWIGGSRGLTQFPGFGLSTYDAFTSALAESEVTAVIELPERGLLLGHPESLTRFGPAGRQSLAIPHQDPLCRVMALEPGAPGKVWVATLRAGLFELDLDAWRLDPVAPLGERRSADFVTHDAQGRLVVSWEGELAARVDGGWVPIALPTAIGSPYLRRALTLADGRLLVTTQGQGVATAGDPEGRVWRHPDLAEANETYSLFERPDGEVWVGTLAGLMRLTADGELAAVTLAGQQIERPIYFITPDPSGALWLGTDDGVRYWDGQQLLRIAVPQGLLGSETNRAASLVDSDGHVWIGTNAGVNVVDPPEFFAEGHAPTVELLAVHNGAQAFVPDRPAKVQEALEGLRFRFRTLAFRNPASVQHRAYLEGFDEGWQPWQVLPQRELAFPNLPAGRYRLHIEARDMLGRTSAPAHSAWITVQPPIWRRAWFLVVAALLVFTIAFGAYTALSQWRLSQRLEGMVAERTAALGQEKLRLEATLSSIGDGVIAVDGSGRVRLWNAAAERITGYGPAQALGAELDALLRHRDLEPASEGMRRCELRTAAGALRTIECSSAPIPLDEDDEAQVIAFRDITERLIAERNHARTQQLEALGMLAGGIAHDFNNLLTVMLGNLTLLERRDELATSRAQLESMASAIDQARHLTRQLLTFSKGGEPIQSPGQLNPVLQKSCDLAMVGATTELALELDANLPEVMMDASQIAQVVHNLVLNARQAAGPRGHVRVTSRASKHQGRQIAEICVEDDGPGVPAELAERIFDPYFSTKEGGTGLGLATAHSIAKRHGGSLDLVPGPGAHFCLRLPVGSPSLLPPRAQEPPPKPDRELRSVLVMDDEEAVRIVLRSILVQLGFACTTTADGAAAVAAYTEAREAGTPFDLVILDLTVPSGMGGQATMKALRELDPEVRGIAMSGYAQEPIMARPREYGFRLSLPKPYGIGEVRAALDEALAETS